MPFAGGFYNQWFETIKVRFPLDDPKLLSFLQGYFDWETQDAFEFVLKHRYVIFNEFNPNPFIWHYDLNLLQGSTKLRIKVALFITSGVNPTDYQSQPIGNIGNW